MTVVITDQTWRYVRQEYGVLPRYIRYGSAEARRHGLIPVEDRPDVLIPEDEWKERIIEAHEKRTMPIHHFEAAKVQGKSQGSTNWCWAYGITSSIESVRQFENQPYVRLAPATLGWTVNWRNVGNYLSDAIRAANERGVASSEYADDGVTSPRSFRDGWEQDALQYRSAEWFDTSNRSEAEMRRQCVSLLLMPRPLYIAYNWWGHALMMAGVLWDERAPHNLRWIAWNSHGDGRIELTGSRGVPDEAYALLTTTYSPGANHGSAA